LTWNLNAGRNNTMSNLDDRTAPQPNPNPPRYTPPRDDSRGIGVIVAGVAVALLLLAGTVYTMTSSPTTTANSPTATSTTGQGGEGTVPKRPAENDPAPPNQLQK
jgi:hypothetical protein